MVRFLDNFSAGTRGAISAEHFLQHGYLVVFLHRQYSRLPYARHYSHSTNFFLDVLELDETQEHIRVCEEQESTMKALLKQYKKVKDENRLLLLEFTSVTDYLYLLRMCCLQLNVFGSGLMLYLAAAVSDFYIPFDKMAEHKVQSNQGGMELSMQQVPKVLGVLVKEWVPRACTVSFKLETDVDLLIPKAKASLARYGHQLVIANMLHDRKKRVILVQRDEDEYTDTVIELTDKELANGKEIEQGIIRNLCRIHGGWVLDNMDSE
jgi:phosphopantothenate-cysteine ligase